MNETTSVVRLRQPGEIDDPLTDSLRRQRFGSLKGGPMSKIDVEHGGSGAAAVVQFGPGALLA